MEINTETKSFSYNSMGTSWKVTIWDRISEEEFMQIREQIIKDSNDFDETYSRFIKTSLVWEIARKDGKYKVPKHFMAMLDWYRKLYLVSDRKLNPLIGFTISDLGYDADYTLQTKENIRPTPDFEKTIRVIDDSTIETTEPVLFDFGALGKGYFVDVISNYLRARGIKRFLTDGSGDIFHEGNGEKIRAGLEDPRDATKAIGVIELTQGSLCASGINRRKWGKYNHVIDPDRAQSVNKNILAVWVLSDRAVLSDALATCLFFSDPEELRIKLLGKLDFEYLILNNEFKIKQSAGFKAELFLA